MKYFYGLGYLAIKNEGEYSSHVTIADSADVRTPPGLQRRFKSWSSSSLLLRMAALLAGGLFVHQKRKCM